jgi:hypothetical protein
MLASSGFLILGDILAILIVTLIGFATHGEADISFLPRMAAIFFPLSISWFLLSPSLGLFQKGVTSNARQLWRPALAMLFAAPLAAVLRGFILNVPVIPIFAVVLASTSAFGMLVWRGIYFLLSRKSTN